MSTFKFPETDYIGCRYPQTNALGRNQPPEVDNRTKEYVYRLLPGATKPKVGDLAVVANSNGVGVCVVTTINMLTSFKREDMAYVIGTVSVEPYKATLERDQARKNLKAQIQAKKKELEESVTLDLLAEKSPEFKALLDAYRALDD